MEKILNKLKIWLIAFRPKTLPAAISPIIVGSALAYHDNSFSLNVFVLSSLCALALQVGSNLANDLFDFLRGADTEERLGPLRVTQAGLLSQSEMVIGMTVVFCAAVLSGIYLVFRGGWIIGLLGLLAIASAILYTAGPYPLGYYGLGDMFVFVFFGLVAVAGTFYLHTLQLTLLAILFSIPVGLLIVNILVVNNYRDIEQDKKSGKRTVAVWLGAANTRRYFSLNMAFAYLLPILLVVIKQVTPLVLLILLSLPLAYRITKDLYQLVGRNLNKVLASSGQLVLLYSALLSLGLIFG